MKKIRSFAIIVTALVFTTFSYSQQLPPINQNSQVKLTPKIQTVVHRAKAKKVSSVISSVPATTEQCKTEVIHDHLMNNDPVYQQAYESAQNITSQVLKRGGSRAGTIYTLPVVFHIIHLGESVGTGTNISDAQVQSAVAALNRDFRRLADDNGIALGSGVDTEIEFCLASRDPGGNPHSGINRVDGTSISGYSTSGITSTNEVDVKALSKWDNRYYVNIWVVSEIDGNNGGSGTQGYAYYPTNPVTNNSDRDGIVMLYNTCGNDPDGSKGYTLKSYTKLGRVLTHEMGHVLNLAHTFDGESCSESDCNTDGDKVCDTPPTMSGSTCSSPACANTIVENYLDYTSETCQDMFTQGQSDRMRATIGGVRNELTTSLGCTPVYNLDATISEILFPQDTICYSTFNPVVTLYNYGSDTLISADIVYNIDGGTNQTYSWTGSLPSQTSEDVTLASVTTTTGGHVFNVTVTNPNGGTDENTSNDANSSSFTVLSGNGLTLTIVLDDYGSDVTWEVVSGTVTYASGGPYADGNSGAVITENICVPDDCYDFTIYDSYGDGLCCDWGNGSYELTEDASGAIIASGAEYTTSETTSFCVPLPLEADFVANATTVLVGSTVDFTDLSSGMPTSWDWDFGDGNVSTAQNPSNTYNATGFYTVTLIVSDGVDTDTTTKVDYIEVVNTSGDCDTLTNITSSDVLTAYYVGTWGYYPGHNSYTMTAYADVYNTTAATNVRSLEVPVAMAYAGSAASTATFTIWDDNAGEPGTVLGTEVVNISDLNAGFWNRVDFSTPVAVSGTFYAGFQIDYSNGDTLLVYTAENRGVGGNNTSYLYETGAWKETPAFFTDFNTSLGINVLLSTGLPTASISQTSDSICTGGSVTFDASSSSNSTAYLWDFSGGVPDSSSNISESVTYSTGGTHNVKLYVQGGCTIDSASSQVTVDAPVLSLSSTNVSCNGACDGTATASVSGGYSPLSYSWSNGGTGSSIANLCSGTYSVTVTDDRGCNTSGMINITEPSAMNITVTCTAETSSGANDGTSDASVSGGTGSYTYLWDDPASQTTSLATGLAPGTYTVTATDVNGCTTSSSCTVGAGGCVITASATSTSTSCFGACDGTVDLTVSGGSTPYVYSWSNAATTEDLTGLCAGSYSVTVTDAGFCVTTTSATVSEPAALNVNTTCADLSAFGADDGSSTASASGGTGTYAYLWNDANAQTTQTATGLSPGTYTVTVSDASGCTASASCTVNNPACSVTVTTGSSDVSCNGGNDGSGTASASGGSTPYSYDWSNGQSGPTATALQAGAYTVTVTDINGCSDIGSVTINEPSGITVSVSSVDVTCNGACDGSATASATGGVSGFSYLWDSGAGSQNTATATGLCAGTYAVTVTDANGCTATGAVSISQPTLLFATVSGTNVTCNGACDGSADLTVGGGTPAYNYSWNNGSLNEDLNNVCAGIYSVTVSDNNGCSVVSSVTITEPAAITLTTSSTGETCNDSNGSASANATGGTGTITYQWSNGATTSSINNIPAGTYTVTVTDGNGCSAMGSESITNTGGVNPSVSPSNPDICDGSSIDLEAAGGNSYLWSNGDTGSLIMVSPMATTTYIVTVSDGGSCSDTVSTTVTVNPIPVASIAPEAASVCHQEAVMLIADGGSIYTWSTSEVNSYTNTQPDTIVVTPDSIGTYYYSVDVSNGSCSDMVTAEITVNPGYAYATADFTTVFLSQGGTVNFSSSGSLGNTFEWNFDDGNSSTDQHPKHSFTSAGIYDVTLSVTMNSCTSVDTIQITVIGEGNNVVEQASLSNSLRVFPNPASNQLNIAFVLQEREDVEVKVFNSIGKLVKAENRKAVKEDAFVIDMSNYARGVYYISLISEHEAITRKVSIMR